MNKPEVGFRCLDSSRIRLILTLLTGIASSAAGLVYAQDTGPHYGPVIEHYGPVFEVGDAWGLKPDVVYRAVLDVSSGPSKPTEVNRAIESAARYLNMHARAGIPPGNIKLAVVLHGEAAKHALSNEAYGSRFNTTNPSSALISALAEAGVDLYLCGQTAGFRGYKESDLHRDVTMASSAMTVMTRLQAEGWVMAN